MKPVFSEIIDWYKFYQLEETLADISDMSERETRQKLLNRISDTIVEYEAQVCAYTRRQTIQELRNRGLVIKPTEKAPVLAEWNRLFDSRVSTSAKESTPRYSDQFRWHLFSFDLLPSLQADSARAAFDTAEKDTLYLFFEFTDEAYILQNAHLLTAGDIEAIKENSPLKQMDLYFLDTVHKWTYIKPHEECCGPYFCQAE